MSVASVHLFVSLPVCVPSISMRILTGARVSRRASTLPQLRPSVVISGDTSCTPPSSAMSSVEYEIERTLQRALRESGGAPMGFLDGVEAFVAAINWTEPLLLAILALHLILIATAVIGRNKMEVQVTLLVLACQKQTVRLLELRARIDRTATGARRRHAFLSPCALHARTISFHFSRHCPLRVDSERVRSQELA